MKNLWRTIQTETASLTRAIRERLRPLSALSLTPGFSRVWAVEGGPGTVLTVSTVRQIVRGSSGWVPTAIAALTLIFPAHGAAPLYTQTSDFPGSTAIASQTDINGVGDVNAAYDNFTLTDPAVITGISWRGGYVLPANPVAMASFTVSFYGTTGAGEPDTVTVLNENIVPGNAGETLVGTNSSRTVRLFDYQLTLPTPFVASAGTKYWMSIVADKAGTLPQWGWSSGTGGDGIMYAESVTLGGVVRRRLAFDLAFTLSGTNVPPTNTPPALAAIPNQAVYANTLLAVPVSATDADQPPQTLTFSLLPGAPATAGITNADRTNGVFYWVPPLGPATNEISIIVTDSGSPALTATQSFTVVVYAANTPPTLAAMPDQTVLPNTPISLTASAGDADQPPQTLTFSLLPGAPAGATISSDLGAFSWTPTVGPATATIAVVVTDSGSPSLAATQRFTVTVLGSSLGVEVGDILVAASSDNAVFKINPVSGALQWLGRFALPTDVALASSGDLYISEMGGAIQRLHLATGVTSRVNPNTTLFDVWGLTLGPSGDLFAVNSADNRVVRVNPATGVETTLTESNLLLTPYGIEVLDADHLVVSSLGNSRLVAIALADGTQTLLAEGAGLVQPWGVGVHGANVYVGDSGAQAVQKISQGLVTSLWTTLDFPSGLTVEPNGEILAGVNSVAGQIVRLDPQGNVLRVYANTVLNAVYGVKVSRFAFAPEPLRIESLVVSNTEVTLTWNAAIGAVYRLQGATNLAQPIVWDSLGLPITATNTPAAITHQPGNARQWFYRLQRMGSP